MKAYTDIEQSKVLAKILPLESADYTRLGDDNYNVITTSYIESSSSNNELRHWIGKDNMLPCWSLVALLSVIPKHIKEYNTLRIDIGEKDFSIWYDEIGYGVNVELPNITMESTVDACYEMIVKLYELNLL